MTGRCLFGFSGEKPFLLPDNEGVKMNTSPVRMDDLPLNRFHCRIAALTFGAHLTDGYVLGVIGYAIIQLTPAMQLTPFMAGMIGGSALLGLFLGSLVLGWISDHIGRQKIFTFSFLLITLASFLQFFATTPEHLIGLRMRNHIKRPITIKCVDITHIRHIIFRSCQRDQSIFAKPFCQYSFCFLI